ncbi:hypothetical protein EDC04DRAFT_2500975, partial [Pisolithus marmoratus]
YSFSSKTEWRLASWLSNSGLSMAAIDELLSLDIAHFFPLPIKSCPLSFQTAKVLRKLIELLPSGPQWKFQSIKTESPTKHGLQVFYQNAIKCLQHLIHSLSNNGQIEFIPKRIYSAADHMQCIYTE